MELASLLQVSGAVVVEGVRGCGKTTTAREFAASEVLLDTDEDARHMAELDPARVLRGHMPRLIDEWQAAPRLWNYVRRAVDDRPGSGQFILTGSASPADDVTRHTGFGRCPSPSWRSSFVGEAGPRPWTGRWSALCS